jgi:hypothetical protein
MASTGDRFFVATRKGLFTIARKSGAWAVDRLEFAGAAVSAVLEDPRDGWRYAVLNHGHFGTKFHRAAPGAAFEESAAPAFPESGAEGPALGAVWCLEPGPTPGTLLAGAMPAALFRSSDRGASWELNTALWNLPGRPEWFGGGWDHPVLHSIVLNDKTPGRIAVAISCGGVWVSEDDGASWTGSTGMIASYVPPERAEDPNVQDPHRIAQCRADPNRFWAQHHFGLYRSDDGAKRWQRLPDPKPSGFGFPVVAHPSDPDTAWFVPEQADTERMPAEGRVVVSRTTDGGKSFELLGRGLPQQHAYDLVYRHALAVDASGSRLALGSTTGGLWISENGGESWEAVPARLPPVYAVRFAA